MACCGSWRAPHYRLGCCCCSAMLAAMPYAAQLSCHCQAARRFSSFKGSSASAAASLHANVCVRGHKAVPTHLPLRRSHSTRCLRVLKLLLCSSLLAMARDFSRGVPARATKTKLPSRLTGESLTNRKGLLCLRKTSSSMTKSVPSVTFTRVTKGQTCRNGLHAPAGHIRVVVVLW
jgi:hypothetical protein